MILEIKSVCRGEWHKDIFWKMEQKYCEYHNKDHEIHRRFGEDKNFHSLRDELKQEDDKLLKVIKKYRVLEGALRDKKE